MQKVLQRSPFLSHFSRVTTRGTFIPEIDGLRFVAILAVIGFHLAINLASRNSVDFAYPLPGSALHTAIRAGDFGVQLFFIVSGFVLALPFARHHLLGSPAISLKAYFLRRLTRLEPPYIVVMIGCFLLLVVVHGRSAATLGPHLLASLVYLHNPVYGRDSLINNVAWSLEVEIQFYILVPWLTGLFAIRRAGTRRAVIAAAILATALVGPVLAGTSPHLENTILRFAQYFLVGFLLADLMLTGQLQTSRRALWWDLLAAGTVPLVIMLHTGSGLATWLPGGPSVRHAGAELLLPWLCFLAYLAVFRGRVANALLTIPLVTTIGGMCYSIYLLHNVFLNNTLFLTKDLAPTGFYALDFLVQAIIMVPLIITVSAIFFVLVERPCMDKNWPRHLVRWGAERWRQATDRPPVS
jgi:peptidoglycan/LPS O-acetylase OafA/YrhL